MPEMTPKSPELLQAQAATFAAERIEHYQDSGHVLNNLGELAIGNLADVTRVTESAEYHKDEAGERLRVPENTKRTVATTSEYTDFLRSVGGSKYEAIQGRADMLTQYNQVFKPIVTGLRAELQDPATRKEHPAFMGNGSNSAVFRITHEGKDYAVRVPSGTKPSPSTIDSHLAGAVLGKGVPHLEQIVAASYEDGVTVAEVMPGKEIGKDMTLEDVAAITDEQLSGLVDTLTAVSERGIEIDPKPTNIFYDREAGFGIVDYHSSKVAAKNSADQDLGTIVGWMATPIMNAGFYGGYNPEMTADDYAQDANKMSANLGVLKRFRVVVESKLDGEDRETALKDIDSRIESGQESIDNYLNPEYVADRMASDAERKRQMAERANQKKSAADTWMTLDVV